MKHSISFIIASLLIVLLSSCGHKGPLYLPHHPVEGKATR